MYCSERVWAEIDLDNLGRNMASIRKKLDPDVKIMAIVKADGYGHGAIESSEIFLDNGADYLGVSIVDEGVSLRKNNINVPILILGNTILPQLDNVVKYGLTQTIFNYETAQNLSETALKLNTKADIHIKIDTGMSRIGFLPNNESLKNIVDIVSLKGINISGIYTHFAQSGSQDKSFTFEQLDKFISFVERLEDMGIGIPLKHAANSGAILRHPSFQLDMVRLGIITYGLTPLDEGGFGDFDISPVMSIKTTVGYVKTLDENISVGYGRTYYTNRKTIVATIPLGYADGYLRAMGNRGRVLVNGKFAPVIGNICMDQFMIDVTNISETKSGDEVVLMGKQGELEITAEEIAEIENTINYEVVCTISKRVPRVYIKQGEIVKIVNFIV